jgi:hypothetical protein
MNISQEVKEFIEKKIVFNNMCLPWHYPTVETFEQFQAGYRYNGITLESLVGNEQGNFKENWYVICTNYFNDPIYVDFSEHDKNYPVYFSIHGAGNWTPILVAKSLADFMTALLNLKEQENNKNEFQAYIEEHFDLDNDFWGEVFQGEEDEDED